MPDLPITQLPSASALTPTDVFAVVQNNITKQVTFSQVATASYEGNSYYGSFYHTASMDILTPNVAYSMSLSTTDFASGVSIGGVDKTQITFANPGVYDVQFSAQVTKTSGTKSNLFIWLNKNGTTVPDTGTDVTLEGGSGDTVVTAWNFFVKTLTANEYVQLMYGGAIANVRLLYEPAVGIYPAIPSLIVTVNRVG